MTSIFSLWLHAARLNPLRLVTGFSIYRTFEYPAVLRELRLRRGERLLDVGPSFDFVTFLAARGARVTAIDYKDRGLKQKLSRFGVEYAVMDAREMRFEGESFDEVTAISVIEHIPGKGDARALREIERVLKKGGRAVVTFPFKNAFKEERAAAFGGLQRYYDEKAVKERILGATNLKPVKVVYFGSAASGRASRFFFRLPHKLRSALGWLSAILGSALVHENEPNRAGAVWGNALVVLEK
ncbi:MAG: class I SAM-dependent methyltransferase [Candidatus Micrarchaeota archaeon]